MTVPRTGRLAAAALAAITVVALAPRLGAQPASAEPAIGISPAVLRFDNAVRGLAVERTIELFTDVPSPTTLTVHAGGQLAPWLTFVDEQDPARVVTDHVIVPSGANLFLGARLRVPPDAENGSYSGLITVASDTGAGVSVGGNIRVTAIVTGSQTVSGDLLRATTSPAQEAGLPVRIDALVDNTGDADMVANVDVTIQRGTTTVATASAPANKIRAGDSADLVATWRSSRALTGEFQAMVVARSGAQVLGRQAVTFSLAAPGSLPAAGELDGLEVASPGAPGGSAQVVALVADTGQQELDVTFTGSVSRGAAPAQAVSSPHRIVEPGQTAELPIAVSTPVRGSYTVAGAVDLGDGRSTDAERVTFRVGPAPGRVPWALIALAAIAVAGSIAWFYRRRRMDEEW